MNTRYGSMHLQPGSGFSLSLESAKTTIALIDRECRSNQFHLEGEYTTFKYNVECYYPDQSLLKTTYQNEVDLKNWQLDYIPENKCSGMICIKASFGSISLH